MNSNAINETPSSISSFPDGKEIDLTNKDVLLATKIAEEEAKKDRDCISDAALAIILQRQFDLEYDHHLKREESRLNGSSKVGLSLDRFRRTGSSNSANDSFFADHEELSSSDHDCGKDNHNSRAAWDVFEESEMKRRSRMMGRSGFVMDGEGNMITKHDIPTSSRKNMCRLMELKTEIQTGDAGATKDDFKITNYVYNHLKVHSKRSSRRATQKMFDKKERENAAILQDIQSCKMSDATRAIMDGLLITFKIEKLNGVIGHGKESTILHATGRDHDDNPGQEVAIKIFKSSSNMAFKTRDAYNKSKCPSYKFDKPKSKSDSLNKWAERGFKNLKLLRKANINCPDAISLKKHVLVMSFLGKDASPSPQLRKANLDASQLRHCYEQTIDIMERMYNQCDLIHGDLSEYNLIWHNDELFVIDLSQSMFSSHPNANIFLYRDCKNILSFFEKAGLADIIDEKELFLRISGKDLDAKDVDLWSKIEDFPRNEKLMQKDESSDRIYERADNFVQMLDSTNRKSIK